MNAQAVEEQDDSYPKDRKSFLDWVKDWFRADGRLAKAVQGLEEVLPKLRSMPSHRGPDPDYDRSAEEIADRVAMIIGRKYRHVSYNNGDTTPPQGNGEKRLLRWILGVLAPLAVIVVVGGVTLYGEVMAIKATLTTGMNAHEQRLNRLEAERDQRYRNAQPGTP